MTPTTTQKQPPRSQWLLALGENADFAPTIIHALADQKLLVYPQKITLYQRGERVLDFLEPRSQWSPLGLYRDPLHAADHFHPCRGDGSYIKSPKTSEDEFWFKQSFANFIKATSTNDQPRLQILVIGISRWIEDLLRRAVLQYGNGQVDLFAVNLWHPSGIRVKHYHTPLQLNGSVEPTVIDLGDARWIDQNGSPNRYALRVFRPDYKNDRSGGGSFYQAPLDDEIHFQGFAQSAPDEKVPRDVMYHMGTLLAKPKPVKVSLLQTNNQWALHLDEERVHLPENLCALLAWILVRKAANRETYLTTNPDVEDTCNFWLRYQYWQCLMRITSPIKAENASTQIFGLSMKTLDHYMDEVSYRHIHSPTVFYDELVEKLMQSGLAEPFATGEDLFTRKLASDRTKFNKLLDTVIESKKLSPRAAATLEKFRITNIGRKGERKYAVAFDDFKLLKLDEKIENLFNICGLGPRYWQRL